MNDQSPSVEQRAGRYLRAKRERLSMTQNQLAKKMADRGHGWLQTTVTKVEAGLRPIRLDEFVAACEVLACKPWTALEEVSIDSWEEGRSDAERQIVAAERLLASAKREAEVAELMWRQTVTHLARLVEADFE